MTIDPDGLTFVAGFLSVAGVGMAVVSLNMKRRLSQIERQLEDIRAAKDAGEHTGEDHC